MSNKHKRTNSSYIPSCTNPFKGRHFDSVVILTCMRWYCKYALSYRDIEEMIIERGIEVDHTTIYRWIYKYAPELDKRINYYKKYKHGSWRVDETYIKVKGKQKYLYRAIDKYGNPIDFFFSHRRDAKSAKRFFKKTLRRLEKYEASTILNTDKNPAYDKAIAELKEEGVLDKDVFHRKVKFLNNIVESDHFRLKKPMSIIYGFKTFGSAYRTIKGMESMLIIKKRGCISMDYCYRDYLIDKLRSGDCKNKNNSNRKNVNEASQNTPPPTQDIPPYKLTVKDKIIDEVKFINKLFDTELYRDKRKKGFVSDMIDDDFFTNKIIDFKKKKIVSQGGLCQKLDNELRVS